MADPIIDERMLMDTIDVPVSLGAIERLQSGALMAAINAFDRKLERSAYIELTASAFSLHTHLGRLHIVARINELFKQGKLTKERLAEAEQGLIGFCESERVSMRNLTGLVAQCPTSNDSIN
jgi:hypothetical protein